MLSEEQVRVAMKSPEHLKTWLVASGRKWVILNAVDMVDALAWPGGVQDLQQIAMLYKQHRQTIDAGRRETQVVDGEEVEVPVFKKDTLEVDEMKEVVLHLLSAVREVEPDWSPDA